MKATRKNFYYQKTKLMSKIEKEFKGRFSNEKLQNDGFDTEGLWNNIEANLNTQPIVSSNSIDIISRLISKPWILGMTLLITVSSIYFILQNMDSLGTQTSNLKDKLEQPSETNVSNVSPMIVDSNKTKSTSQQKKNKSTQTSLTDIRSHKDFNVLENNPSSKPFSNINTNKESKLSNDDHKTNQKKVTKKLEYATTNSETKNNILQNNTDDFYKTKSQAKDQNTNSRDLLNDSHQGKNSLILNNSQQRTQNLYPHSSTKLKANSKISEINESQITKLATAVGIQKIPSIKLIPIIRSTLYHHASTKKITNEAIAYPETEADKNELEWNLTGFTGINSLSLQSSSDTYIDYAIQKNQSYSSISSYTIGIQTNLLVKEKVIFNTGIEYHNLWLKLDYSSESNSQKLLEQQLTEIIINSTTGDTLNSYYEDVLANVVNKRTIVHYNNSKRLSIPIQVGLQGQNERLSYGIKAGASMNFNLQQNGRTFDNMESVINYTEASSFSPFNKVDIGFRLSPFIDFRFTDRIGIRIEPQWNISSKKIIDPFDLKTTAHILNLNLGMSINLN